MPGKLSRGAAETLNYDDYIDEADRYGHDPAVRGLVSLLRAWKDDASNVRELVERVDRHFGHSWIEDDEVHAKPHKMWVEFKAVAIDPAGGMTMNERLH